MVKRHLDETFSHSKGDDVRDLSSPIIVEDDVKGVAFCELVYGEKVNMDGVRSSTMTCLALETLPLPVYDIMAM